MPQPRTVLADTTAMTQSRALEAPETATVEQIDPGVFAVKLWNPPPPPPEEPKQLADNPEPAKPLRLQLIGIITEHGILKAAVYDQDSDRLLIVASGDHIAEHTITEVNSGGVKISDGRITRTLRLKEDHS